MSTGVALHPADIEAVELARIIRNGETVFVGVNSPLPMAAALMARATTAPDATLLTIAGGINPTPSTYTAATSDGVFAAGSASIIDNLAFYD
ncbi:MAG: CoA transferase, partial [Nocardioidaceae bacterium]